MITLEELTRCNAEDPGPVTSGPLRPADASESTPPLSLFRDMVAVLAEGLVLSDADGHVVDANPAAASIIGMPLAAMKAAGVDGVPWRQFGLDGHPIPREKRPGWRAVATGLPQRHTTMGFERSDGSRRWVDVTSAPIGAVHDDHATPRYIVSTFRDVTDELVRDEEVRFQARLLDAVGDAIIGTDECLRITFWNRAAEDMFGYLSSEAIGEHLGLVLPDAYRSDDDGEGPSDASQISGEIERVSTRKDGSTVHLGITLSPALDDDGRFCGGTAVARDITDRLRAAEEAEWQRTRATAAERVARGEMIDREAAERANLAKSEFLSRMSHELRTPLNAVIGFSQILQLAKGLTERESEGVDHILQAGKHLLDLINEVLDISRIETDQLNLSVEPVDIADVLTCAVELLGPAAAARDIVVTTELSTPVGTLVMADRQRFVQVVLNLLSNAIKYNVDGGLVEVSVVRVGGSRLRTSVRNTGPGIDVDKVDRLFTPFDRLGAEQTGIEGTGVGLALSKGLVEHMGGTMSFTTSAGAGATFWFDLESGSLAAPIAKDDAPPPAEDAADDALVVLYIEDNLPNLKVVESMLAIRHRVTLLSAMQGRLGLELAQQQHPDLILLDVHLPEMEGGDVLRAIRADADIAETLVAVVSADATTKQIERMKSLGADHYLTKPFDMPTLLAIVDEATRAKEGRAAPT